MVLNSYGSLRIRTYTAGGALPVSSALVRIQGAEEGNRFVMHTLLTDRDGLTEKVILPAPAVQYSLSPSPAESPYSVYDVEISADGYYTKRIEGLTVFAGIDSVQLVNMIPSSGAPIESFPRGNVNATIPNNEDLQ